MVHFPVRELLIYQAGYMHLPHFILQMGWVTSLESTWGWVKLPMKLPYDWGNKHPIQLYQLFQGSVWVPGVWPITVFHQALHIAACPKHPEKLSVQSSSGISSIHDNSIHRIHKAINTLPWFSHHKHPEEQQQQQQQQQQQEQKYNKSKKNNKK